MRYKAGLRARTPKGGMAGAPPDLFADEAPEALAECGLLPVRRFRSAAPPGPRGREACLPGSAPAAAARRFLASRRGRG